ncbi:MAG: hypothetical protein RL664_233 [Bacteroidota bacterium]
MKQTLRLFFASLLFAASFVANAQIDSTCTQVSYTITPGSFPGEMSYTVVNTSTSAVVAQGTGLAGGGVWCLPAGCYGVNMFDSFGDGWNGGSVNIFVMGEGSYTGTFATGNQGQFMFGVGVGNCGTASIQGCMDPSASNYNPVATVNIGCLYEGCTDAAAINYNSNANVDDGSCTYCNGAGSVNASLYICTFSNGNQVTLNILNSNGDTVWTSPVLGNVAIYNTNLCLQAGECYTAAMSNNAGLTGWNNGYFWINNGQGQVIHTGLADNLVTQSVNFSIDGTCGEVFGCTNPLASNFNPAATIDDGSCILVYGCTDSTAVNYNPLAVADDGSCFTGCTSGTPITVDFNPGQFANESSYNITDSNGTVIIGGYATTSNTTMTGFACLADGCFTLNMYDSFGDGWDGGSASGITVTSNGVLLLAADMLAGSFQSEVFGVNSDCSLDTTGCTTSIELMPDSMVEMENAVMIYWNEDLSNVSYVSWDFGNGMTSNEFYPVYFYDSIGTYTVCLTVYYMDGCSASSCVTFTMDANGVSGPGGAQMNGFWLNTTGTYPNNVNELTSNATSVNMFPNPTSGNMVVKASQLNPSENTTIRIYSIDGKEVFANNFGAGSINNTFQLNVSELSNGYYFLSLQNSNQIQRVPFVKE